MSENTLSISLSACKFVAEKVSVGRPPEKGHLKFPFLFWNAFYAFFLNTSKTDRIIDRV
jgi:hypothetical protein